MKKVQMPYIITKRISQTILLKTVIMCRNKVQWGERHVCLGSSGNNLFQRMLFSFRSNDIGLTGTHFDTY